ncbi:plasmid partitioning protein RepB [Mesorhizobium sp. A623]
MKGRDILKSLVEAGTPTAPGGLMPHQRPSGAVKALNMGLNRLNEEAAEAKVLREALANSESVFELDPSVVDASIVSDRLSSFNDPAFNELKNAIETSGQQVPVLVRRHPTEQGRYQAAYGHRRIRVAGDLGRKVKAIVRPLTDAEMVIAQGQENGQRLDLSFIERAVFAAKLDAEGFDRDVVCSALGIDKPEVSRLLTVANSVSREIINAIGPAPKAGRPRWLKLAETLKSTDAASLISARIQHEDFRNADSDARFKLALTAATIPKCDDDRQSRQGTLQSGIGSVESDGRTWRLTTTDKAFGAFLERRLDTLFKEFETAQKGAVS